MVELIVVIGIVLALGALVLPVAGRVQEVRDNTICMSNLRQVGLGILNYAHDHNGLLPGPLYSGQYPWWPGNVDGGHRTQLTSYISSYLDLKKTRTKWNGDDVFVCPAFKRVVKRLGNAPVYRLRIEVPMGEAGNRGMPFGYPNSLNPDLYETESDFPPMRLVSLADIRDANGRPAQSSTWMLKDADQDQGETVVQTSEYLPNLPATRVHKSHRNALFFDLHVAPVDRL